MKSIVFWSRNSCAICKLAQNIILEPAGRNTAPAIALAALTSLQTAGKGNDPLLLVLAADHVIRDDDEFRRIANYIECNPANWEEDRLNKSQD